MKVVFPKRMSLKTAIHLCILHWARMIRWAKKQKPKNEADGVYMKEKLGEEYDSSDCALCRKYKNFCFSKCPLSKINHKCDAWNRNNLYGKVVSSVCWKTWVKNAEKMLKVLKSLRSER